jgi:DNA-binding ferritin-like protein (Dps family)
MVEFGNSVPYSGQGKLYQKLSKISKNTLKLMCKFLRIISKNYQEKYKKIKVKMWKIVH